jgi:hypothetical protein
MNYESIGSIINKYKTIIIILVSLIILSIISLNIHLIYKSNNDYRHKGSESLYAHFSMIDRYNYFFFPKLLLAHPIKYTLKEGQSLYIPKQWWHWVKTVKRTFAINYWFDNKLNQKPFIFDHTIEYDINLLNDEIVYVWKSDENKVTVPQLFKEFYNSGMDNRFILTVNDYDMGDNNINIKNKIAKSIVFPKDNRIRQDNNYSYNVWISSNKHDTGLHYDDEDGVLTVINGEKEIILFPPSDSKYLYPYEKEYNWKNTNNAENFRYNSFCFFNKVDGVSSGELLYVTCNNDKRVLNNISKLYKDSKKNNNKKNLVWGFKKNNINNEQRWEIYDYMLCSEPFRITSRDIYINQYNIGDEEHYYYNYNNNRTSTILPFWGYGKYKKNNIIYDESKIFVIAYYMTFHDNYDTYMTKLGYEVIKEQFKDLILNKYYCYELCIFNKNPDQIFVMYLGISNKDFLEFLIVNSYPKYIIEFVKTNMENKTYNINNEIAVIYDIKTQKIIRSSFYGVI